MAKLIVDFDVLQSAINTYNDEISNFRNAKTAISRSLSALRSSGWDSQASRVWFSLLDDEWLKNIEYQIRVLERLRDNMVIAKTEYEEVKNKQDALADCL